MAGKYLARRACVLEPQRGAILLLRCCSCWKGCAVCLPTVVPDAALLQAVAAAATFPLFFRLQHLGGPVLLSQIGYVAASVGLVIATVLLDEQYSLATWFGALVIAVGIALTVMAQRRV